MTDLFRWLFACAFLRLCFGGDSASSTSSSTTNYSETNTTDRRSVADGQGVIVGDGADATVTNNTTTTTTDLGAIQAAMDLAQQTLVGITKLATDSQTRAGQLATAALSNTADALGKLEGAYENANKQAQDTASGNKTLAILALLVAGVIGLQMIGKGKA